MIVFLVYFIGLALWYSVIKVKMDDGPATHKDRLMLAALWPFFTFLFVFFFLIGLVFSCVGAALAFKFRRKR